MTQFMGVDKIYRHKECLSVMYETLLEIARAGVLAPSADNNHVFRIEFTESALRLWPTAEFATNTERLRRVLGLISLGAVVENMQLRASELGFVATTDWFFPEPNGPIAQVNLVRSITLAGDELAAAIPARHTNRRMYHGPGLGAKETTLLDTAAAAIKGTQLIWLTGDARKIALSLIWRAESERFLRKQLHEDLFSSIRFDLSWHETADRALPPGSLEIEAPMRPMFKALRHWALMRPLSWIGVHRLIGLRAGWLPAWQAPALGLITTSLPIEQGAIAGGATLERVWLRATQLGLAMQPMAASAALMQPSSAGHGASDQLRSALTEGWAEIAPGKTSVMVFRIGRAVLPTVRAGRRPVEAHFYSVPS
jgi:hypothetical protein